MKTEQQIRDLITGLTAEGIAYMTFGDVRSANKLAVQVVLLEWVLSDDA